MVATVTKLRPSKVFTAYFTLKHLELCPYPPINYLPGNTFFVHELKKMHWVPRPISLVLLLDFTMIINENLSLRAYQPIVLLLIVKFTAVVAFKKLVGACFVLLQ